MSRHAGWVLSLLLLAAVPSQAADRPATATQTKSLQKMAADVQALVTKEKIQTRFDLLRKVEGAGLTWQPSLLAPNDLAGKLDEEGLRLYAGMKLVDAVYAATFRQRKALADSLATIEAINDKLQLRSHADLQGTAFRTLRVAAAAPDTMDVPKLLQQLSSDYVSEVPVLMSNEKTAEYLVDSLYGAEIELGYLLGQARRSLGGKASPLVQAMAREGNSPSPWNEPWNRLTLDVAGACGRGEETITVQGRPVKRLASVKDAIALRSRARQMTPEQLGKAWEPILQQTEAIRTAILTPAR